MSGGGGGGAPKWLMSAEELIHSPSRVDGVDAEEEKKLLCETNWFVQECGKELKLPPVAVMTGQTFLNRFYALQSFARYDRWVAAQACLFLAAKVEEAPTKLYKIVTAAYSVRKEKCAQGTKDFDDMKKKILSCERAVLFTIDFDVDVTAMSPVSPFSDLLTKVLKAGIVPSKKQQKFGQAGVKFISDSLRTNLCLQFDPKDIAAGCALLAIVFLKLYPKDAVILFKILSISERKVKTICSAIIEIYLDVQKCDELIVDLNKHNWIPDDLAARRISQQPGSDD